MARALLNNPALLLADEPTGNLDPKIASATIELVSDYHREGGTVVVVTHQDWMTRFAERVIELRDGRIVKA